MLESCGRAARYHTKGVRAIPQLERQKRCKSPLRACQQVSMNTPLCDTFGGLADPDIESSNAFATLVLQQATDSLGLRTCHMRGPDLSALTSHITVRHRFLNHFHSGDHFSLESEGREWVVGSVVVDFRVFGAPRFSVQTSQNTSFKGFGGLWTENWGAPKTRKSTTTDPTPHSRPSDKTESQRKSLLASSFRWRGRRASWGLRQSWLMGSGNIRNCNCRGSRDFWCTQLLEAARGGREAAPLP